MNDKEDLSGINAKNKIEAVMFSCAKLMSIKEISELTNIKEDLVRITLNELKVDYESRGGSMLLRDEGEGKWKLTVKDHYLPIVHKLVSKTELDKPLIETLAVIAWKYPVLQADVIKIRHNKAYEHMKILEEMGFVTRIKFGRTRKITLTDKFFEYFDLPSEEAKKAFENQIPTDIKEEIKKKEEEIDEAEEKIERYEKRKAEVEELRRKEKSKTPTPKPLEVDETPMPEPEEIDEKIGQIEEDIKELEEEENKDPFEPEN